MTTSTKIADTYYDVHPRIGDVIEVEEWGHYATLIEDVTGWEKCDYRIPVQGGYYELATKIEISGTTIQWRYGQRMVRIRIILVGDEEPDTILHGWAYVYIDRIDAVKYDAFLEEQAARQAKNAERFEREKRERAERRAREQQEREAQEQATRKAVARQANRSRAAALEF